MKLTRFFTLAFVILFACQAEKTKQETTEMDSFVEDLLEEMTIQEKIGQLNLITQGGGTPTGSVVSTDVESKMKSGKVGGIFGVYGSEKTRQAQTMAVEESRLGIPMLFGSDVIHGYYNPSGKLVATFPRNVGQIPIYHAIRNTGRPQNGDVFAKFKSNYFDAPNSPLFPFGYGLSYTTFEYNNLQLNKSTFSMNEPVEVSMEVTNTGNFDGEEVVQLYVYDEVASITRPLRELKGFKKIFLKRGETQKVTLTLNAEALAFYHPNLEFYAEPGDFIVFAGGDSEASLSAKFNLK